MSGTVRSAVTRASIVLLAALPGCAGGTWVSGSLEEVYDTRFEYARARLYESQLAIEYVRGDGAVPVRVTVDLGPERAAGESTGDVAIPDAADLSGALPDGTPMPLAVEGKVSIDGFTPADGALVSGDFSGEFRTVADTLALTGHFVAPLEVVTWEREE